MSYEWRQQQGQEREAKDTAPQNDESYTYYLCVLPLRIHPSIHQTRP